jgi:hypothetical protein
MFMNEEKIRAAILIRVPLSDCQEWLSEWSYARHSEGIKTIALKTGRSVIIKLPESWEEYKRFLSKAHKKTVSRRINGIKRHFNIRMVRMGFERQYDPHKLDILIRDALSVSKKSWQGSYAKGRAISDSDTLSFFIEASIRLAEKRMLDLSVLYADGKPVSFIWGAVRPPKSTILKLGFDKSYAKFSPGTVHLAKLIRDSIEHKWSEIDFGHEFYDYKSRWGKHNAELYSIFYFPKRIVSTVLWYGYLRYRKLKSALSLDDNDLFY